jgi:hypothetical protein
MVKKYCLLFFLFLIAVTYHCADSDDDDKLSFTRTPYDGTALRFDGYYYIPFSNGDIEIYFLFRNGNFLYGTYVKQANLSWMEEIFANGTYYNKYAKNDKTNWGVFRITGNTIEYERWVPANGMERSQVYRYTGEIINETTFNISKTERVNGEDQRSRDETYHFKQFSPKPDSVTQFIP